MPADPTAADPLDDALRAAATRATDPAVRAWLLAMAATPERAIGPTPPAPAAVTPTRPRRRPAAAGK